jgi:hypothetical protein
MKYRKQIFATAIFSIVFFSVGVQDASAQACNGTGASAGKTGVCNEPCGTGQTIITPSSGCSASQNCCALASTAPAGGSNITIPNPLKYTTVDGFVSSVMSAIQGIVVVLAILAIVIGGVMYVISAGNSGLMTSAKGAITGAMIGLAIVIAAPSFLKEVYSIVGGKENPAELQKALSLTQIATNALEFLLSIVGIIAIIMLIVGGLAYLTSGGDSKRADVGKEIVKNSLIGIAIVMGALIIVKAIAGLLMGSTTV